MKGKFIMFSLLLVALLLIGGAASAQNINIKDFCGNLSEADCNLLAESQEVSAGLHSGATQFDMSFSISNIPDAPFSTLGFNLNGSGVYAIDPVLMQMMLSMQDDPTALFSSPDAFNEWLVSFIKGVSGDFNLTLNLPAELTGMMSSEDMTVPQTLSIGLRMVDGKGYVNLADIAAAAPDAGIPPGWVGIDLAAFMEQAMQQSGVSGMEAMSSEAFQAYMKNFQDPTLFANFMTIERVEDTVVAGQPAAVFHYTFDYSAFFQSEAFQEMMRAQMALTAEMSGGEFDADMQAEMDEAMSMMGPMLKDINLEVRQTIGLEDKYIHITEMHMDWDMTNFMAMVEPDSTGPAPNFVFDMTITSSDFNVTPVITAPEDAMLIPLESMMPSTAASS